MNRGLIVFLLHFLAFAKAVEETVCKDGVQQVIDVPTTPPPFTCEDLEWPDEKTLIITKVEPEEVEFVYGERFTISCKVCTRYGYQLTVTGLEWSKQEGELPEDVRVGVLDLESRPAETTLLFSHPSASDEGVYKCTPRVNLTTELPPILKSVSPDYEDLNATKPNETALVPPTEIVTVSTVVETDAYVGYIAAKEADACAGDDPRFSIPLGNGHMLCFSVDGKHGDIFNLISDANISVNVKYIDGTDGFSVWMGEVAFVLDTGCKVLVNANPESVLVGNTVVNSHFYDADVDVKVYPGDYVTVKFTKLRVQFRLEFIDGHLSFYVVDDQGFSPNVHGLIGQFLNSKHEIIQAEDGHKLGLLKLQGRTRAIVLKQKRWPYMRGHKEATCWGIQGKNPKGAVDWSHSSYKMKSLCHTKHRILTRPVSLLFGSAVDKTL